MFDKILYRHLIAVIFLLYIGIAHMMQCDIIYIFLQSTFFFTERVKDLTCYKYCENRILYYFYLL